MTGGEVEYVDDTGRTYVGHWRLKGRLLKVANALGVCVSPFGGGQVEAQAPLMLSDLVRCGGKRGARCKRAVMSAFGTAVSQRD